jgi:hypothetical protein
MNELLAIAFIAAVMAVFYAFVYPKAKRVGQLRLLDLLATVLAVVPVGLVGQAITAQASVFGFEVNWFLYALIAYIVIETPLWYYYMKAHPEQGTWAQLYGFARSKNTKRDAKVAKSIDTVMQDTKWDGLRTPTAQRILVLLGIFSLILSPVVYWFEDFIVPGIGVLTLIPIFLVWWLLRISVRLVADAPDEYLDEFQVRQRDRTYLHSFRILAGIVSALAVVLMVVAISTDFQSEEGVDYYHFALTFGQINSVIWIVLGSAILVPNLVLAWNQANRRVR